MTLALIDDIYCTIPPLNHLLYALSSNVVERTVQEARVELNTMRQFLLRLH